MRLAGPKYRHPLGALAQYRRDPLSLFYEQATAHGGSVRLRIAHKHVHLLVDPAHIRQVLMTNGDAYEKGISYTSLNHLLGPGLMTSEGERWKRQRALIQPAFHRRHVEAESALIGECADRLIRRLDLRERAGEVFDLVPEVLGFAADVVCRCVMGSDIGEVLPQIESDCRAGSRWIMRHMSSPLPIPPSIPTPANLGFRRVRARLHRVVDEVIRRHRHSQQATLLGRLVAARDDQGHAMDDEQLRHEVLTFLLAGHETTGETVAWTIYELCRHRALYADVTDEVDRVLHDDSDLSYVDPEALELTGRVVDESLRLHPPAWAFSRTAREPDAFDRFEVPNGAVIVISPFVNHRWAEFWPSPLVFDPERFTSEAVRCRAPFQYFPFGSGPHLCVGLHLALLEARVAVAALLSRFDIELVNGLGVRERPEISNMPGPVLVRLRMRPRGAT